MILYNFGIWDFLFFLNIFLKCSETEDVEKYAL